MADAPLYVVQITDCHLFANPKRRLLGVETEMTFQSTLTKVRTLNPFPDVVLLTGDLSQDGSVLSYARLRHHLRVLPTDIYWLAGNHDRLSAMQEELGSHPDLDAEMAPTQNGSISALEAERAPRHRLHSDDVFTRQNWTFILLNSQIPGKDSGYLNADTLAFLETELERAAARQHHVTISLHHPPFSMHSEWLDTSTLRNASRLFAVLDRFTHVRVVLFGHVHQEFCTERRGVTYMSCPSTCIQFKPRSSEFALDLVPPAFRQLWFHADGRVETELVRLPEAMCVPNLQARGY
ncbi:MAG: phosphodiesterase [Cyanobacteria bacterium P01_F01_bin.33]